MSDSSKKIGADGMVFPAGNFPKLPGSKPKVDPGHVKLEPPVPVAFPKLTGVGDHKKQERWGVPRLPDGKPPTPFHPLRDRFEAMVTEAGEHAHPKLLPPTGEDREVLSEKRFAHGVSLILGTGMDPKVVLKAALPAFWVGRDKHLMDIHQLSDWSRSVFVEALANDMRKHDGFEALAVLYETMRVLNQLAESGKADEADYTDIMTKLRVPPSEEYAMAFRFMRQGLKRAVGGSRAQGEVEAVGRGREEATPVSPEPGVITDPSVEGDREIGELIVAVSRAWDDDPAQRILTIASMLYAFWQNRGVGTYMDILRDVKQGLVEQDNEQYYAWAENLDKASLRKYEHGLSNSAVKTVFVYQELLRAYLFREVPEGHIRFEEGKIQGKREVLEDKARVAVKRALSLIGGDIPPTIHQYATDLSASIDSIMATLGGELRDDGHYEQYVTLPDLESLVNGTVSRAQMDSLFKDFIEGQLAPKYGEVTFFLDNARVRPQPNVLEERSDLMATVFSQIANEDLKKTAMTFWAMHRVVRIQPHKDHQFTDGQVSVLRLIRLLALLGWELPMERGARTPVLGREVAILEHWMERGYDNRRNAFQELTFADGFGLNRTEVEGVIVRGLGGGRPLTPSPLHAAIQKVVK